MLFVWIYLGIGVVFAVGVMWLIQREITGETWLNTIKYMIGTIEVCVCGFTGCGFRSKKITVACLCLLYVIGWLPISVIIINITDRKIECVIQEVLELDYVDEESAKQLASLFNIYYDTAEDYADKIVTVLNDISESEDENVVN